jgi:hypothetical protein
MPQDTVDYPAANADVRLNPESRRTQSIIRLVAWLATGIVAFVQAWSVRFTIVSDGNAYLDIASNYLRVIMSTPSTPTGVRCYRPFAELGDHRVSLAELCGRSDAPRARSRNLAQCHSLGISAWLGVFYEGVLRSA